MGDKTSEGGRAARERRRRDDDRRCNCGSGHPGCWPEIASQSVVAGACGRSITVRGLPSTASLRPRSNASVATMRAPRSPAGGALNDVVDVRMAVDHCKRGPLAEVLRDGIERRTRGLDRYERVEHDPAGVALHVRDVRQVVPAHLVNAIGHLEQQGEHSG